jgi:hypothetical protein
VPIGRFVGAGAVFRTRRMAGTFIPERSSDIFEPIDPKIVDISRTSTMLGNSYEADSLEPQLLSISTLPAFPHQGTKRLERVELIWRGN